MDTKYISFSMFAAVAVMAVATAQSVSPQDSPADRVNRMSEADQIALVKAILDHGLPNEQQSG